MMLTNRTRRGVALIMAMVILALISLLSTTFFYEASLENRTIYNYRSAFIARSVVKSLFKAVLVALAQDERRLFTGMSQIQKLAGIQDPSILNPSPDLIALPQGVIPDLDDAILYTPYIRPIDHLFNLNRMQTRGNTRDSDTTDDRKVFNEFYNIMRQIPVSITSEDSQRERSRYLSFKEITSMYAAIFDWMDAKDNGSPYQSEIGITGVEGEAYIQFRPAPDLTIKNRRLDRLSEIRLIQGVAESQVPDETWQKYFTVHEVGDTSRTGEAEPRININLATEGEIAEFIRRFDENSEYYRQQRERPPPKTLQNLIPFADSIASELLKKDNKGVRPRYTKNSQIDQVTNQVTNEGFLRNIFIFYSQWYDIRLIAEADGIQAEIQAVVYVPRNKNGLAKFENIQIKDFIIR